MVKVADGKYEVLHENGAGLRALRYGEPWRDLTGDGLVLALVQRIEELEEAAQEPPPQPVVVPGREEVWLRIYAALAGALGADGATSRAWADKALEEFDKRFPPR